MFPGGRSNEIIDYPKLQILLSSEIGFGIRLLGMQSINSTLLAKFQVEVLRKLRELEYLIHFIFNQHQA